MVSNLKYWIWLSSLVKISPRRRVQLLDHFGDPALIWECTEAELRTLHLCTPQMLAAIMDRQSRKEVPRLIDEIGRCDINAITINDSLYPVDLKNIPDPPVVLYYKGKLESDAVCVAVVGSRIATPYGLEMARQLSQELAKHGVTIISGMARGIDSKAHSGALEGGGRTVAVLGCGVDIVYPSENISLMNKICQYGAVISEYLPGTPPIPFNFPARNRIISGLSQGVAIVEANEKSGSLITADFALEQGRDVYAVPGNINSMNSTGTNKLIKDGAKIVTNAGDILDELKISHGANNNLCRERQLRSVSLGGDERTIAQRLLNGPAHIDIIARDCGISIQLAGSVLVMLELSGFVEQLPGKFYKLAE